MKKRILFSMVLALTTSGIIFGMAPGQFKKLSTQEQIDYIKKNTSYKLPYGILKNLDAQVQQAYAQAQGGVVTGTGIATAATPSSAPTIEPAG
jgi:hypothetical protein